MTQKQTVFVVEDYIMTAMLDDVAEQLRARGIAVIRGAKNGPGKPYELPRERWDEWLGAADVAIFSVRHLCPRPILEWAPRLRGVIAPAIGTDTIDVAAASELGVIVGHGATPENFLSMSEAGVMLMLMLLYNPNASRDVLYGRRERPRLDPASAWAQMAMGKTLGLIGCGRIARGIIERLQGWGMRIVTADPYLKPELVPAGVELVDFDSLMRESDVVCATVTLTPETRHLVDERALRLMKPTAFFINIARGGVVDEAAIERVLRERRIAGAALDVFEIEPLPADSPLRTLDNCYLTPHLVGHTKGVYGAMAPAAVENTLRILAGEPPLYCKNPEALDRWRARLERI